MHCSLSKHICIRAFSLISFIIINFTLSASNGPNPDTSLAYFNRWPTFEAITNSFYLYYKSPDCDCYVDFAKKPAGWFVRTVDFHGFPIEEELFWDPDTRDLVPIDYELISEQEFKESLHIIDTAIDNKVYRESSFYEHNLFYGYNGWDSDVIKLLDPKRRNLNSTYLYYLARAWVSYGKQFIAPNISERGAKYLKSEYTLNPADLNEDSIMQFVNAEKKGIRIYREIWRRDPGFTGILGHMHTTFSSEHMNAYLQLKMAGRDSLATIFLVDSLYSPFLLEIGKNYLKSCKPNAILFAVGDNDYFILIYLQEKLRYRKDVTVISYGLAAWGRYIYYVSKLLPDSHRVNLSIPLSEYSAEKNDYVVPRNYEDSASLKEVIAAFSGSDNGGLLENEEGYKVLATRSIFFPLKESVLHDYASYFPNGFPNTMMNWETRETYIFKDKLFFWDLLYSSGFSRPIYFASPDYSFGFGEYLLQSGFVYQLTPFKGPKQTEETFYRMINEYAFAPNVEEDTTTIEEWWVTHIKYAYLIAAHDYDSIAFSKPLMEKALNLYPSIPFQRVDINYVDLFYKLGLQHEGDSLLSQVFRQKEAELKSLFSKNDPRNTDKIIEQVELVRYIEQLLPNASDRAKEEIERDFNRLMTAYEKY